MVTTKPRGKYQAVSLPIDFVKKVRKHILSHKDKANYRSIAEFTKLAVIEKMDRDSFKYKKGPDFEVVRDPNDYMKIKVVPKKYAVEIEAEIKGLKRDIEEIKNLLKNNKKINNNNHGLL